MSTIAGFELSHADCLHRWSGTHVWSQSWERWQRMLGVFLSLSTCVWPVSEDPVATGKYVSHGHLLAHQRRKSFSQLIRILSRGYKPAWAWSSAISLCILTVEELHNLLNFGSAHLSNRLIQKDVVLQFRAATAATAAFPDLWNSSRWDTIRGQKISLYWIEVSQQNHLDQQWFSFSESLPPLPTRWTNDTFARFRISDLLATLALILSSRCKREPRLSSLPKTKRRLWHVPFLSSKSRTHRGVLQFFFFLIDFVPVVVRWHDSRLDYTACVELGNACKGDDSRIVYL